MIELVLQFNRSKRVDLFWKLWINCSQKWKKKRGGGLNIDYTKSKPLDMNTEAYW